MSARRRDQGGLSESYLPSLPCQIDAGVEAWAAMVSKWQCALQAVRGLASQLRGASNLTTNTLCYQRENVYKTFRFTPRTTRIAFFWGAVVPLAAYYAISGQDVRAADDTLAIVRWCWAVRFLLKRSPCAYDPPAKVGLAREETGPVSASRS